MPRTKEKEGQKQDALRDSGEAVQQIWRLRLSPWNVISNLCPAQLVWRKALAEHTLVALNHFPPQLHGRIPGAWKKLKTWRRHEMPRHRQSLQRWSMVVLQV